MNILVVDDEYYVVEGIVNIIRQEQLDMDEVYCAYSAAQARKVFMEHPISILITDVEMPRENGFELLQWMTEHKLSPVVMLLTGHRKFEYAYEAVRYNCYQYLLKPIQKSELCTVLGEAMVKAQMDTAFRNWMDNLSEDEIRAIKSVPGQDVISRVKRIIRTNLSSPELNRKYIAEKVFLNEDYLSYIFHREAGETLNTFIQKERIRKIKVMLLTTDLSMESISEKNGFTDPVYMRKIFKKWEGVSPGQFRRTLTADKRLKEQTIRDLSSD